MQHTYEELRDLIKKGLQSCTHSERVMFCKMYAPKEYRESRDNFNNFLFNIDALAMNEIDSVVDRMYDRGENLLWALSQIERTLKSRT